MRPALLWALLLVCASAYCAPGKRAQGLIEYGGQRWSAVDAITVMDRNLMTLLVSDQAFDLGTLSADGHISMSEIYGHSGHLLRLGLAGLHRVPTVLALHAPGQALPTAILSADLVYPGLRRSSTSDYRIRGTLSAVDAAQGIRIEIAFDVIDISYIERNAPPPQSAIDAARELLAQVADPNNSSWPEALHKDMRTRWMKALNVADDLDVLAQRMRTWFPVAPVHWRTVIKAKAMRVSM
jgi:hypothetical protein